MTDLRTAAQQALDDLKDLHTNHNITYADTIWRLEAALAQEPHRDLRVALQAPGCERLREWVEIGPVQRAALETFVAALAQEQAEPTRSQQMVDAGFKTRDTRLQCDECGKKFTRQMLSIHKCKPAKPKSYAVRMHFEWVDGRWLFNDNPIDNGEWCITLGDGGWVIYPKVEQAEPKVMMLSDPRDPQRVYMAQMETQPYREAWTMRTSPSPEAEPVALPCCGYTDAAAIKWNPYNQVVQCHHCGQIYTAPFQHAKPLPQLAESQCPYPEDHPSLRDAWLDGWEAAERAHGIGGQDE